MNFLISKYSNWQVYGFFGLFLSSSIWTYYGLFVIKMIYFSNDVISDLSHILPFLGIYVGSPFFVSSIILLRMKKRQMVTKSNFYFLVLVGFSLSAIVVAADYFIIK